MDPKERELIERLKQSQRAAASAGADESKAAAAAAVDATKDVGFESAADIKQILGASSNLAERAAERICFDGVVTARAEPTANTALPTRLGCRLGPTRRLFHRVLVQTRRL